MTQPMMTVHLRPIQSATSPAMRAPKKVPQDKMETMSEVRLSEIASKPSPMTARMKMGELRTPLM